MRKGAATKERILDRGFRLAARDGLGGLTLSALAAELGMSKSGMFAHFRAKEELQVDVLQYAAARFEHGVIRPALQAPRGLPRLKKLFDHWLGWTSDPAMPGGCIFIAAAAELDDKPGRPRDYLVAAQKQLRGVISKAAQLAIEEGHLRGGLDCDQLAFELYGIILVFNHDKRLLGGPKPAAYARAAFKRLIAAASPSD